ncbi:MAG: SDR family NAD(P)-dependent oxidoreductase [Myxococcota bacterium]
MATLVTGANRGIGRALAERLAHEGPAVVIGARDAAKGEAAAAAIRGAGHDATSVVLDVASAESVARAARELEAAGVVVDGEVRGDVLVNAACPGWVATDMGGAGAPVSPEEAAAGLAGLLRLPAGGPSGRLFDRHGREVPF